MGTHRPGPSLRLTSAVSGIVMIAMAALARSWGQMAGLVVVGGIAMTSATNLWLARAIGGRRIGLAFGIKQSGGPAAAMPAGLAVPTLATVVGWRWTFAAFGVFALVGTLSVPRSSLGGTGRSARAGWAIGVIVGPLTFGLISVHSFSAAWLVEASLSLLGASTLMISRWLSRRGYGP